MRALEMEGGREEVLRGRGTSREARDGEEPAVVFEERAVEVARGAGRHPAGDEGLEALAVGVAEEVEARFLVEDEVVGGRGCAGGEEGPGGVEDGAESGGDALAVLGSGWEAPGSTKKAPRAARSASVWFG